MDVTSLNWITARVFFVVVGLTLVSIVGLPFLGVAIETVKPATRFGPRLDRFLVFEAILYAVSGIVSGGLAWVLTTQRSRILPLWTMILAGTGVSVVVPLVFLWVLSASMTAYFFLYILVTAPTLLGAYLVTAVILLRRHPRQWQLTMSNHFKAL